MNQAIQIQQYGGPEVMKLVDLPVGEPGPGEIRIRHHAVGLNYIDVYQRTGLYANPLPLNVGMEGAGIVEAVGAGVTHLRVGDREGSRFTFHFCPVCGTTVFHTEDGCDGVSVAVGAFADPDFPAPEVSIYDARRHGWVRLPNGISAHPYDPE